MALSADAQIRVESGSFTGSSDLAGVWTNNLSDLFVATAASVFTSEAQMRVDALTGAGTVLLGDGSLTVGVANGSGTFDGTLINQGPWMAGSSRRAPARRR
jgi:hypothetical protein